MLTLTYEYKLIPDRQQIEVIEHTFNVCRSVWNYALRERKDWLNSRKSQNNACSLEQEYIIPPDVPDPNYHKQALALTKAKKTNEILTSVLKWVAWKRDVFVAEVDKNFTSQICPNCGFHTGKKTLDVREHNCPECGYQTHRDVAAAQVIRNRGLTQLESHSSWKADLKGVEGDVHTEHCRSALGHRVSTARPAHGEPSSPSFLAENACGDGLTGALTPSQESVKQELLNVNLRISRGERR
ncbi:MAG: zinc ribbon domain-containing protein [Crocosphaera sp.]